MAHLRAAALEALAGARGARAGRDTLWLTD